MSLPYLYFSRVVDDGLFKGFQLHGSVNISHIFYAEMPCSWRVVYELNLIILLKFFNLASHLESGLKINIAKSQVLGVGVSQNVVVQAANRIGCVVLNTPFRYLGVTVGECMSRKSDWVGLVPKGVLKTMESIRSKFFNGVDSSDRKISWVAWDNVLASKLNGGLGVSSFFALNRALLLKWVWRFISGDGSLCFPVCLLSMYKMDKEIVAGILKGGFLASQLLFAGTEWFGCPYAFKGQFVRRGHGSNPFILLEVVVSQDLWIWHAFFGVAGSNNNINVLYQSSLFNDLKTGRAPEILFVANGISYPSGYYLVDGIYPEFAPLVKTILEPSDDDYRRILYKQKQESTRKDVERALGVLKKKLVVLANLTRALKKERIVNMMYSCIILHNMIRKYKKVAISLKWFPGEAHQAQNLLRNKEQMERGMMWIRSSQVHQNLRHDLIEHLSHNV
ncbi:ALP1-like protein [Tanacetum coccineum]